MQGAMPTLVVGMRAVALVLNMPTTSVGMAPLLGKENYFAAVFSAK
jgi:hypothetical protein